MSVKKDSVTVRACAKINLHLEILGTRPNGYHDIRSVMVPVSLCDYITLRKSSGAIRTVMGRGGEIDASDLNGCNGNNLATRAAVALKESTGYRGGALISIDKNIPLGGGLGGGSADAAAVLRGLNQLWGTGLDVNSLVTIGAGVGCDVPGMVYGGAVMVEGLGEKVTPIPMHKANGNGRWWVVLVNPGIHISTKDIYTRCRTSLTSEQRPIKNAVSALKKGSVIQAAKGLFNGLQATVVEKYPLIGIIAARLEKAGAAGVILCGSGASVFGLAKDERHAREIAEHFGDNPGFPAWIRVVSTLPDGVMAAHGPLEA